MRDLRAFDRVVTRHGDRTALVGTGGETQSYTDLDRRTDSLAAAIDDRIGDGRTASLLLNGSEAIEMMIAAQKRGRANAQLSFRGAVGELVEMVRTASLLLNGPEAIEMMIAAQKRGRANAQLSFRGAVGELVEMVRTAEADGLVFDAANAEMARGVLDRMDLEFALFVGDDPERPEVERYDDAVAAADGDYDATVDPDAETGILYTSGTTSRPKAVLQDQRRVWLGASQVVMEHGLTPDDIALVTTPWYHDVTSIAWIYPHLQVGATLVLQPEFVPPETMRLLGDHDVTGLLAVPAQLEALLGAQADGEYDVSALSYVRTGGAVVPPSLVERVRERLTEGVYNTYGLTEGIANLTHAYPAEQLENPGTVGHASFNWEVRVVEAAEPDAEPDPTATVGRGATGELIGRGPCVDGYIDSPEAEDQLFVGEWLRTMDVARVDDSGGLHIVDRVDNMLVSGGENIYPQEVELALEDHPEVRAAAVLGLPDDEWGERVAAVVVSDSVTAEELEEYCLAHDTLADFKRPRTYVVTTESLPRTDTGTLRYEEIGKQYFDG